MDDSAPWPQPVSIVRRLPRVAPFVAPEEWERRLGHTFLARLGANESVFGPSPLAVRAMAERAKVGQWYGDPLAYELRAALAGRFGGDVDNYLVGAGIDGLLIHIARAFLDIDRTAVTTLGSYPTFDYAAAGTGASLIRVPYKDFAVDLDDLARVAIDTNAELVYFANPDNPSGSCRSPDDVCRFRRQLSPKTLLVLDEAYADFLPAEHLLPLDFEDRAVLRLRTFSKAHGLAGLRVAFATGHPATLAFLNRVRPHFEVSSVAQAGAIASLNDRAHLDLVLGENRIQRESLREILARHSLAPLSSSTNFVLGDAGTCERASATVAGLMRERVFVRKPGQPPLDRFIRVSVGRPEDLTILDEALRRVLL